MNLRMKYLKLHTILAIHIHERLSEAGRGANGLICRWSACLTETDKNNLVSLV